MEVLADVSLKSLNTFGIDARAAHFAEAGHRDDIYTFLKTVYPKLPKPLLILGGGSNVLFTGDPEGTILKISTQGITVIEETHEHVLIKAEAGENWALFVDYCIERNWGGLENLSLIPGNVGSSPIQNIGAYGVEMKDCFHSLEALDTETLECIVFTPDMCKLGYRTSVFKNELKGKYIILSVTFRLMKNPVPDILYGALAEELMSTGVNEAGIKEVSEAVVRIRQMKLPDPRVLGNAGSFFKNPAVSAFDYYRLKNEFPGIIGYNNYDGTFKLAAGWLIEQCGWKGYRRSDAGVHAQQALILINYGKATGKEILELSDEIRDSVQQTFGVLLETEVNIL